MIKDQLIIGFRGLFREKLQTLISITGLVLGIASFVLIMIFVDHELSYDNFHEAAERTYRIESSTVINDKIELSARTPAILKTALELELDGIEHATRLFKQNESVLIQDNKKYPVNHFLYADQDFFHVFTIPLLHGDPATALMDPFTMVISSEMATQLFGEENPVGKTLRFYLSGKYEDYQITGVSEKVPANSHFTYHFLASFNSTGMDKRTSWRPWNIFTYMTIQDGYPVEDIEKQLSELYFRHISGDIQKQYGSTLEYLNKKNIGFGFSIIGIRDIHLSSSALYQMQAKGNLTNVYFFTIVAFLILGIALINSVNLFVASYTKRTVEISIRKVLGASRLQLISQFLVEAVMISILALVPAFTIVELVLQDFGQIIDRELTLSFFRPWHRAPLALLFGLILGLIMGTYPSLVLSSMKPASGLRKVPFWGKTRFQIHKFSLLVQFAVAISLISWTAVIWSQLNHVNTRDLGFQKEGILILDKIQRLGKQRYTFRDEILTYPQVVSASLGTYTPGSPNIKTTIHKKGSPPEDLIQVNMIWTDEFYQSTLGIQLVEGRYFSNDLQTDQNKVVINERFAQLYDASPIGEELYIYHQDESFTIVGVISDVKFESMHQEVLPLVAHKLDTARVWTSLAIRYSGEDTEALLKQLEEKWNEFTADELFTYQFLDENIAKLYAQENRSGKLFTLFSLVAIFIACIGLMAKVLFLVQQRRKEIGIRKVHGADTKEIFLLLNQDILLLVFSASILSWPIAWYFGRSWLNNFAYRVDIHPGFFILGTLIAFALAILAAFFYTLGAARANPVDSLKYE